MHLIDLSMPVMHYIVHFRGDITFKKLNGFQHGMPLSYSSGDIRLGRRMQAESPDGDDMQGSVGGSDTIPVETLVRGLTV